VKSLYPELSIDICPFKIEERWTEKYKEKPEIEDLRW
jgi:hypothetical protein